MNALTFELYLKEPLLATQPASGEENSATSYAFVPGGMLRGALIAAYQRTHNPDNFLNDESARRLFFDGGVRYLNAYPFHFLEKQRMLPLPASWRVEKDALGDAKADVRDFAFGVPESDQEFKTPSWEYCLIKSELAERYDSERYLQVHNASSDRNKKDAQTSQVFRYEALAAGEILGGVILVDDGDFALLRELLEHPMRLGGSHTAGYGRVEIKNVAPHTDWREIPNFTPAVDDIASDEEENSFAPDAATEMVVTLLSDVIVRGADFDAALARALGVASLKHTRAFASTRWVGGFNRTAGLPFPQEWALRAGSVFVYEANALDQAQTALLYARGIGERTVEGFGRVGVNWQTKPLLEVTKLEALDNRAPLRMELDKNTPAPPLSETSERLAKEMAGRQLRAKLERTLIAKVNAAKWNEKLPLPKNSQLSRVRTAARTAVYAKTLQPLQDLLKSLKGARKQYETARIGSESLLEWLETRLEWSMEVFRSEFEIGDAKMPRVGGRAPDVDDALRVEFIARWIDGVMQRGQKLNRAKEGR